MLAEMRGSAAFGELVAFESADEARSAFERYLREQAERKRSPLATKAQELVDNQTIENIMEAYDRAHGEFEHDGMSVMWSTVDGGVVAEYDSEPTGREGDAMS